MAGPAQAIAAEAAQAGAADGGDSRLAELFREHQSHNNAFFNGNSENEYWIHDERVTLHGGFDISQRGWSTI